MRDAILGLEWAIGARSDRQPCSWPLTTLTWCSQCVALINMVLNQKVIESTSDWKVSGQKEEVLYVCHEEGTRSVGVEEP